jgi:hypothetical protein
LDRRRWNGVTEYLVEWRWADIPEDPDVGPVASSASATEPSRSPSAGIDGMVDGEVPSAAPLSELSEPLAFSPDNAEVAIPSVAVASITVLSVPPPRTWEPSTAFFEISTRRTGSAVKANQQDENKSDLRTAETQEMKRVFDIMRNKAEAHDRTLPRHLQQFPPPFESTYHKAASFMPPSTNRKTPRESASESELSDAVDVTSFESSDDNLEPASEDEVSSDSESLYVKLVRLEQRRKRRDRISKRAQPKAISAAASSTSSVSRARPSRADGEEFTRAYSTLDELFLSRRPAPISSILPTMRSLRHGLVYRDAKNDVEKLSQLLQDLPPDLDLVENVACGNVLDNEAVEWDYNPIFEEEDLREQWAQRSSITAEVAEGGAPLRHIHKAGVACPRCRANGKRLSHLLTPRAPEIKMDAHEDEDQEARSEQAPDAAPPAEDDDEEEEEEVGDEQSSEGPLDITVHGSQEDDEIWSDRPTQPVVPLAADRSFFESDSESASSSDCASLVIDSWTGRDHDSWLSLDAPDTSAVRSSEACHKKHFVSVCHLLSRPVSGLIFIVYLLQPNSIQRGSSGSPRFVTVPGNGGRVKSFRIMIDAE